MGTPVLPTPETRVPRYFFHVADGVREADKEGVELSGDAEAQRAAVAYLGAALEDDPDMLWRKGNWRVEVTDENGRMRWTVMALAVDAPGPEHLDAAPAG